jgi:hypothetical protein
MTMQPFLRLKSWFYLSFGAFHKEICPYYA